MKNKEKYKDRIIEIMVSGDTMGIANGKPVACHGVICETCDMFDICAEDPEAEAAFRREWAEAEAEE